MSILRWTALSFACCWESCDSMSEVELLLVEEAEVSWALLTSSPVDIVASIMLWESFGGCWAIVA